MGIKDQKHQNMPTRGQISDLSLPSELTTLQQTENFTEKIQKILDFLQINSYIKENAVKAFAYGRFLKELGQAIEDEASNETLKYLKENEINFSVSGINVSYREYYDTIYPKDKQISKYEERKAELEKELKTIKESIKNREKQLEEEGRTVKLLKNRTLSARKS